MKRCVWVIIDKKTGNIDNNDVLGAVGFKTEEEAKNSMWQWDDTEDREVFKVKFEYNIKNRTIKKTNKYQKATRCFYY